MRTFIFFIAVLFSEMIASQNPKTNKRNKIAVDFEHSVSGISAPLILGDFDRTAVYTDSKNDSVFSAEYKRKNDDAQFKFQIIVGYRDEERLFNFYFRNLKERRYTPRETINKTVVFKDGNFRLNGISTYFKHLNRLINVRIYDAGFWMFVSETSQKGNDTLALDTRQNEFLEKIDPSKIVEKNPLTRYTTVYYAKAAFRDSLMMRSTISSSMNKLKWVYDNINKYQRASGIPGNALDYQIAGINGFIDYKSERNPRESKGNDETTKLIGFFTKLRDAGFIDEFLMESYYYLLVHPENHKFDFEDYQKWKLDNSIEYNVFSKYYIIENLYKKTDLSKEED